MADETWPSGILPGSLNLYPRTNTTIFESPGTRRRRTVALAGVQWVYTMQLVLSRANAQVLDALLDRLRGPTGTIAIWDFAREEPLGSNLSQDGVADAYFADVGPPTTTDFTDGTHFAVANGDIVVSDDYDAGVISVETRRWRQSQTDVLKAGDLVSIDERLYRVTADANSTSLGRATLQLNRGLVADVANAEVVTRSQATGLFSLVDDDQPNRGNDPDGRNTYNLSFVEAL